MESETVEYKYNPDDLVIGRASTSRASRRQRQGLIRRSGITKQSLDTRVKTRRLKKKRSENSRKKNRG